MKPRLLLLGLLLLGLPALACSAPARLLQSWRATPTPLPSATPTREPTALPSPTLQPAANLLEQPLQENNDTDLYEIDAVFPYLSTDLPGVADFNAAMADFEQTTLASFRREAADAAPAPSASPGSFLQSHYEVLYNQAGLLSLRMWVSIYMKGAAHPGTFAATFNYDLSSGQMLRLDDLFLPDTSYLDSLAQFCQAEVLQRDSQFWADGASAAPDNYRNWNLTGDGLLVTFDEYQVAPYAAGAQSVLVPYARLAGLLDPAGPLERVQP